MLLATLLSAVHLLSSAGGVSCLFLRHRALKAPFGQENVRAVLAIDNASGLIAITWMGSGLWRAFGAVEKGSAYYLGNSLFWVKMALLLVVWGFEMVPMLTFIRWRGQLAKGESIDTSVAPRLRALHVPEVACVALMVFVASGMARGMGQPKASVASAASGGGAAVYAESCAPCHQVDGRGMNGQVAADFVGDPRRLAKTDEELLRSIAKGVPNTAMPAFEGRLSEAQRLEVLAHIRARFGGR